MALRQQKISVCPLWVTVPSPLETNEFSGSKNSLGNLLTRWLLCVCFAFNVLGRKANLISELWGTPERQIEIQQFSICPIAAQEQRKQLRLHIQVVTCLCIHCLLPLLRAEREEAGGHLDSVGD